MHTPQNISQKNVLKNSYRSLIIKLYSRRVAFLSSLIRLTSFVALFLMANPSLMASSRCCWNLFSCCWICLQSLIALSLWLYIIAFCCFRLAISRSWKKKKYTVVSPFRYSSKRQNYRACAVQKYYNLSRLADVNIELII